MKYQLNLDYTIPLGDLAPYFEALQNGKALASECTGCGNVAFPARVLCKACGDARMTFKPLKGTAQVPFRSDGGGGSFAMAKFDGADTLCTVGLINPERNTSHGKLVAPLQGTPGLWLSLVDENSEEIK